MGDREETKQGVDLEKEAEEYLSGDHVGFPYHGDVKKGIAFVT